MKEHLLGNVKSGSALWIEIRLTDKILAEEENKSLSVGCQCDRQIEGSLALQDGVGSSSSYVPCHCDFPPDQILMDAPFINIFSFGASFHSLMTLFCTIP